MHQSQPSLYSLRIDLTVHLELWPGNHLIWCNATCKVRVLIRISFAPTASISSNSSSGGSGRRLLTRELTRQDHAEPVKAVCMGDEPTFISHPPAGVMSLPRRR